MTTTQATETQLTDLATPEQVKKLHENDQCVLVDVRSASEFASARIDGSVNLTADQLIADLKKYSDSGKDVVLVCRSGLRAKNAQQKLQPYLNTTVLEGGVQAWARAGHPTVGQGGLSIERQTQLTIGLMLLTFTAMTYFVHPAFLGMIAFIGCGLTVAGATGFCGLAIVISKINEAISGKPNDCSGKTSCTI